MAFMSLTDLVQRCVVRLRQVPGVTTQSYSETVLAHLIEECYEQCRSLRWWDHLMAWREITLDGVNGYPTVAIEGARERMRDVQGVYIESRTTPLPMIDKNYNPTRYTGTTPRAIEALDVATDPNGWYLFRVWPILSTGVVQARMRLDPISLFTTPATYVPFDATALINGACMKYAVMDGTNPGSVMEFDRAYNERVQQLQQQHDSVPLALDSRNRWQDEWREVP